MQREDRSRYSRPGHAVYCTTTVAGKRRLPATIDISLHGLSGSGLTAGFRVLQEEPAVKYKHFSRTCVWTGLKNDDYVRLSDSVVNPNILETSLNSVFQGRSKACQL